MADLLDTTTLAGTSAQNKPPLTAAGGPLELPPSSMAYAAVMADGSFYCLPAHRAAPAISTMKATATLLHIQLSRPIAADLQTIAALYGNSSDAATFATDIRKKYFDFLSEAAHLNASDFQLRRNTGGAFINYCINGEWSGVIHHLATSEALAMWNVAFNLADAGDSIATAASLQNAITAPALLPAGVIGLRQQFDQEQRSAALVIRLLYDRERFGIKSFEDAGFDDAQLTILHDTLQAETGVTIIAAPTGQGKSTIIDLAIEEFRGRFAGLPQIRAVEDPPESHSSLVVTNSINRSIRDKDEAYETALAAALRVNPNAIKIGEIRDRITGAAAYKAASAGTFVFTTLHTASALDIPGRLRKFNIDEADIFGKLNGLWASQRLMPLVCPECAIPFDAALTAKDPKVARLAKALAGQFGPFLEANTAKVCLSGPGCNACKSSPGIKARKLVAELLVPTPEVRELLRSTGEQTRNILITERNWRSITLNAWPDVLSGDIALNQFVNRGGQVTDLALQQRCTGEAQQRRSTTKEGHLV